MAMGTTASVAGMPLGMAQLDVLLPSQHFGPRRKPAPEQRLMIAVLEDALDCIQTYRDAKGEPGQRLFREAKQWILAEGSGWPYSFECICETLDLDSNAVRRRLDVGESMEEGSRPEDDT